MYIFQLYGGIGSSQIAIRPGMINRVVTRFGDNGEDYAMIYFRSNKDEEETAFLKHSLQEVVDAINKNSDYF